jgi:hypothetical protein
MTTLWEALTRKRVKLSQDQLDELDKVEAEAYYQKMRELKKAKGEEKAKEDARRI